VTSSSRLPWIDWMRGLACVLMFQTHCYDAWLGGNARNGVFFKDSQRLGTLPAPLFLFLAGISFAIVVGKLIRKNASSREITRRMALHGAQIFAFGLLFRLQEYLIAWGWAPWSDLFRVDILNTIGLSMILMALLCGAVLALRPLHKPGGASNTNSAAPVVALVSSSMAVTILIALLTPPLYTTWRPTWLPWPIESYIDGCHNLGAPQPWLFPMFPWTGFAFAGLAAGFILFSDWARERAAQTLMLFGGAGTASIWIAWRLDHSSVQLYGVYDYWHTSPNFFMMRVGLLLLIAYLSYAWCRWGLATRGSGWLSFSPLVQLGQTSLLVYWVHIEFVYGRFSILPRRAVGIGSATRGLIEICIFMLVLSLVRTRIDWQALRLTARGRISQPAA
jgi:uncharacterized membrane protein